MVSGPSAFLLSQILVGIAFAFDLLSFQLRTRKQILLSLLISCALVSVHFMLLGNVTAAALFVLISVRFLVSAYSTSVYYMTIFLMLGVVLGAATYEHPVNLLAVIGSLIGTYASFQRTDRRLRTMLMVGTFFWMAHNVIIRSPAAAALEMFFLASNVVGYYRFYIRKAPPPVVQACGRRDFEQAWPGRSVDYISS